LKARCSFKTPFLFAAAIYKSCCSRKESSKAFCFFLLVYFVAFIVVYLSICFHFNRKFPFENYSKTLYRATLFCRGEHAKGV
jgi:hypothetical protein